MKKLFVIICSVVLTCFYLNADAQVDESKNFVYFSSDSVLYAKNVRLRTKFLGSLRLEANGERIPLQDVSFINTDEGLFANIRKSGKAEFSERVVAGRINLYKSQTYSGPAYSGPSFVGSTFTGMNTASGHVNTKMFYNKGYQDLKKVDYANLKLDMADHAESIDLLESYKKRVKTSKMLYIGAGASFIVGVVSMLTSASNNGGGNNGIYHPGATPPVYREASFGDVLSIGFLGAGMGLALGGYFTHGTSFKKLEAAIDSYNR